MDVTFDEGFQNSKRFPPDFYQHFTGTTSPTEICHLPCVLSIPWFPLFFQFLSLSQLDFPLSPPTRPFSLHLGA